MSHFLLSFYFVIHICTGAQFIYRDEEWNKTNGNITCNQVDGESCIIQCSEEYSCGSSLIDGKRKPFIICPQNGSLCAINCIGKQSCVNNVIMTGNCNKVQINIHNELNAKMIINAPKYGYLSINVFSDYAMFDHNIINAHSTHTLDIHCNGKGVSCQSNIINAESIQNMLNISCTNGANCGLNEIHCPDNNKDELNPKCDILCDGKDSSCYDMNIFAMNGTNERNGVSLQCDAENEHLCDDVRTHCADDRICDMTYHPLIDEWYCNGIHKECGDDISALIDNFTISTLTPTFMPTFSPTQTTGTTTSMKMTQNDDVLYEETMSVTLMNENEVSSKEQTLEIIAYLLLGGLIGGSTFCAFILCIICCVVKQRVSNRKERELEKWRKALNDRDSGLSSDSKQRKESNDQPRKSTIGSMVMSELKETWNGMVGLQTVYSEEQSRGSPTWTATDIESVPSICNATYCDTKSSTNKDSTTMDAMSLFSPRTEKKDFSLLVQQSRSRANTNGYSSAHGEDGNYHKQRLKVPASESIYIKSPITKSMMKSMTMSPKVHSPSSIQHSDDEKLSQLDVHTNEHDMNELEISLSEDNADDESMYLKQPKEGNWREHTQTRTKTKTGLTSTLFNMRSTPQKSDESTTMTVTVGNTHCHSSSDCSCSCSSSDSSDCSSESVSDSSTDSHL